MKRTIIPLKRCLLLAGWLLLASCAPPPGTATTPASSGRPQSVALDVLFADPARYDGEQICTEGIAVEGFEANALGAGTREQGQAVYLTEPTIWIAGAEKEVTGECTAPAAGGDIRFCPATVCGLFEAAGDYGHMGQYRFQISQP